MLFYPSKINLSKKIIIKIFKPIYKIKLSLFYILQMCYWYKIKYLDNKRKIKKNYLKFIFLVNLLIQQKKIFFFSIFFKKIKNLKAFFFNSIKKIKKFKDLKHFDTIFHDGIFSKTSHLILKFFYFYLIKFFRNKFFLLSKDKKNLLKLEYLKRFLLLVKKYELIKNKDKKNLPPQLYVTIKIGPNNTHIVVMDKNKNTLKKFSVGLLGLHSSKRSYKFIHQRVTGAMINYVLHGKGIKHPSNIDFSLLGPKHLVNKFISYFKLRLSYNKNKGNKVINLYNIHSKAFNGCRFKKIRRKKNQRIRVLKFTK